MINMKLFLILFTLLSATSLPQQKYFQIEKNNHGGFNIYDNNNAILYEFTKKNIDSLSLSTLNDIFLKADKSKSDKQQVAVINLQEKGVDYSNIIIALASIISGLGGLWVGYIFNKKSQKSNSEISIKKSGWKHLGLKQLNYVFY